MMLPQKCGLARGPGICWAPTVGTPCLQPLRGDQVWVLSGSRATRLLHQRPRSLAVASPWAGAQSQVAAPEPPPGGVLLPPGPPGEWGISRFCPLGGASPLGPRRLPGNQSLVFLPAQPSGLGPPFWGQPPRQMVVVGSRKAEERGWQFPKEKWRAGPKNDQLTDTSTCSPQLCPAGKRGQPLMAMTTLAPAPPVPAPRCTLCPSHHPAPESRSPGSTCSPG